MGVTPAYMAEMASAFRVRRMNVDDATELKSMNVSPAMVRGIVAAGYAGISVDDIAEEQRLPPRMAPDAAAQLVAEALQQAVEGVRAAVDVADQVVATARVEFGHSLPPRRLPQPSLVRQTS